MSDIAHLTAFIKFWFGHSSLKSEEIQTPHSFQISCLASKYQRQILKVDAKPKEMAFLPEFFAANEDEMLKALVQENRRGYDMFFFTNAVRQGYAGKSPTDEDIERRLFFPIDFDYRLPVSVEEMESELGLQFAAVTISSQREHKHHQAFIALDWNSVSEEDRLDTTTLARRICRAFGSDNMGDLRRIMRLPGMINWKTAELKNGAQSDTALVRCAAGKEYSFDEILAAVEKFEASTMSSELRSLRVTPIREGGTAQGERGEFGRWDKVLEAAREGVASVKSGGRHNALASWGCQMASARLPWGVVADNLDLLAQFGVSPDYKKEEPDDFARLLGDLKKKWASIDEELDAVESEQDKALDAFAADEKPEWQWMDDYPEKPTPEGFRVAPASPIQTAEAAHKNNDEHAKADDDGHHQRLNFGPTPHGPASLIDFAQQVAKRLADEKEEHWLAWLGEALNGANHFDSSDIGSISKLCSALQRRLAFVGALRHGNILGPVVSSDEKRAWSMTVLSEPEARLVVRHLLFTASGCLLSKETRRKVGELPEVQREQKMKKKPRTVFAAKGELLTQVEREMMLRLEGKVQTVEGRQVGRGLAAQNGVIDLERWSEIRGAADPWDDVSGQFSACFLRNKEGPRGVLDPRVSWMSHEQCAACSFSLLAPKYLNGHGQNEVSYGGTAGPAESEEPRADILAQLDTVEALETPMFDAFLADCFGEDLEARRGVLRVIAYCLLPDNPLQRYFFFEGVGGSGKGTLAGLIACMAGTRTTERLDIERMKSDAWLGPLESKNVVIVDEAEEADPRTMRRVMKEIARVTGSDIVSARSMYGDARQIKSGWKFILIANEQPDSADKSGQQSRRVVPLYFGRKKEGGIIPLLHREIYRKEGDKIFMKAVHEYALVGMAAGERLFDVDSTAFTEGKKRFEQSTGGIRGILKVFEPREENAPKMFVEVMSEIWIDRKESRKFLHRALDKAVTTEMAVLGFQHKEQLRMPWKGPDGNADRLSGFQGCGVNTQRLLDELEMMPDELLSAVREKCGKRRKLWLAARALLELPEKDFANAEGQSAGQQSFFD